MVISATNRMRFGVLLLLLSVLKHKCTHTLIIVPDHCKCFPKKDEQVQTLYFSTFTPELFVQQSSQGKARRIFVHKTFQDNAFADVGDAKGLDHTSICLI